MTRAALSACTAEHLTHYLAERWPMIGPVLTLKSHCGRSYDLLRDHPAPSENVPCLCDDPSCIVIELREEAGN